MLQFAAMATEIRRGARIHAYVTEHLDAVGMTQKRLAALMDVNPSTITGYKQAGWDIEPSKLAHIAHILGLKDPLDIFKPPAGPPIKKRQEPEPDLRTLAAEVAKLSQMLGRKK